MEKLTAAQKREQKAEAIKDLRELCPPGTTVYTVIHTAARSGASQTMTAFVIETDKHDGRVQPRKLNHFLWKIGVANRTNDLTLRVAGGGMNMGASLVMDMARALYPDDVEVRRTIRQEWL